MRKCESSFGSVRFGGNHIVHIAFYIFYKPPTPISYRMPLPLATYLPNYLTIYLRSTICHSFYIFQFSVAQLLFFCCAQNRLESFLFNLLIEVSCLFFFSIYAHLHEFLVTPSFRPTLFKPYMCSCSS